MCVGLLSGCESDNVTTHIKGKVISIETYRYTKRIIIKTNNNMCFMKDNRIKYKRYKKITIL